MTIRVFDPSVEIDAAASVECRERAKDGRGDDAERRPECDVHANVFGNAGGTMASR